MLNFADRLFWDTLRVPSAEVLIACAFGRAAWLVNRLHKKENVF